MSAFDKSIPELLERQERNALDMVKSLKIERDRKLNALDKELSEKIAHWEGQVEALSRLKDLKWDHYAKVHLENK